MCRLLAALALTATAYATGCATVIPAHGVHLGPEPHLDRPPPLSILAADLEVSLDPLRRALESAIPPRSDGSQLIGGLRVEAQLVRDPVQLTMGDGVLVGQVTERGRLSLALHGQACSADDARLGVEVRMRPTVTPRDGADGVPTVGVRDVQIRSLVSGRLRCRLGPASFEVALPTELALPVPGLGELLSAIRLPIGFLATNVLKEAQKPRALSLGCLRLHPRRLVLSPTRGDGNLQLSVGLEVAPMVVPGPCLANAPDEPLAETRVVSTPLGGGFAVLVAVSVRLGELEQRAQVLVGQRLGPRLGSNGLVVRRLSLASQAGRLVARVTVDGPLRGDLILVGHPVVDRAGQLTLADLALDFESASALDRLRFALARLIDRKLTDSVRRAATVDLAPIYRDARAALAEPIALGPLTLRLQPSDVRVHQLSVGSDALRAEVVVEGHGQLQ